MYKNSILSASLVLVTLSAAPRSTTLEEHTISVVPSELIVHVTPETECESEVEPEEIFCELDAVDLDIFGEIFLSTEKVAPKTTLHTLKEWIKSALFPVVLRYYLVKAWMLKRMSSEEASHA